MASSPEWKTDDTGDALWDGDAFLGCTYRRDGNRYGSAGQSLGWRALAGEDLVPVGDALPTPEDPDGQMGARRVLEAHLGASRALPTAAELLEATGGAW
jgi:hypothetical protein